MKVLLVGWLTVSCLAQSAPKPGKKDGPVLTGLKSSFAFPWRDLLKKKHDSEWRNLLDGVSVRFSTSYPLKTSQPAAGQGEGFEGAPGLNRTFNTTIKYTPLGSWFGQITHYHYFRESLQRSWSPDFSYGFGYNDWRPYTLSLTYANYGGNRLRPDRAQGEKRTRFRQGTFTLGWKFKLPKDWERALSVSSRGGFGGALAFKVTPDFTNPETQLPDHWKKVLSLSFKYTIHQWIYVNASFNHYLDSGHQQPWDPDFTYGFGFFDWHPGTFSLQYNNYSGNRLPGREPAEGTGLFENGSISLSWGWSF